MNKRVIAGSVSNVAVFPACGSWPSKSGGELNVLFSRHFIDMQATFFNYNMEEVNRCSEDIRGLRIYRVKNIPKDGVGGKEFHRVRHEIILCVNGGFVYKCEDLYGQEKEFVLTPEVILWIPPFVMHTYTATADKNSLIVLTNTQYDQDDPKTHDRYSPEEFYKLQKEFSATREQVSANKEINQWPTKMFKSLF